MTHANTNYIGRFAPSPTGPLHFGSLVAAVASFLDARSHGGRWLLRIEDVDSTRCNAQWVPDILATLTAFGFAWDGEVLFQSHRTPRYQSALESLVTGNLAYACQCSRKEIADSALAGIDGPVYPGTCRNKRLSGSDNAIRVLTTPARICFDDRVQGKQCQQLENEVGDFVLKRRDGLFAYQLAVVIDDADQNISHIVRGADLLDSTCRQIHLQQLLGFPTPSYLHIPIVTNDQGQKLSKQTLAPAISANDACKLLRGALAHLGQAIPDGNHGTPGTLLWSAVASWNPAAIPKRRSSHIP